MCEWFEADVDMNFMQIPSQTIGGHIIPFSDVYQKVQPIDAHVKSIRVCLQTWLSDTGFK